MSLATRIAREWARLMRRLGLAPTEPAQTPAEAPQKREEAPDAATMPEPPPPPVETRESAPRMDWRFGGFDGLRAVEDERVQIGSVKMGRDRMTYKFTRGDLSAWGLSREDAGAIAAAFYWDGEKWVGGKFDWISTSRTSRDWKNIRAGYHGWDPAAFFAASRRAFCIVSRDGKRRTNLAEDWK